MWNLKNDTNEFIYKTETYKLREQTYDYQEEWRERREIDWEFRIEIDIYIYIDRYIDIYIYRLPWWRK